jgi:hypothetical protein
MLELIETSNQHSSISPLLLVVAFLFLLVVLAIMLVGDDENEK